MPGLSLEDRDAVYDVLRRYIWCMDTADVDGIAATFTRDGTVKDITGRHWDGNDAARNFASHFIDRPDRPAAQHWVQHMDLAETGDASARVTSYWFSVVRDSNDDRKFVTNLGRYIDTCVKIDGRWLIKDKQIDPWNNETVLAGKAK
jgi:SnoaL-like domain